jgi:DNA (cytosine-5)-methyltransferase 1
MEVLDLFCGMVGFAQGFKASGFSVTGADKSQDAGRTFELNKLGSFKPTDLSRCHICGNYDVIIGGPPCKPWSAVNTTKRGKRHRDYILLSRFFEHIEINNPKVFILENVPLLAGDKKLHQLIKKANKLGYSTLGKVVTYSDYEHQQNATGSYFSGQELEMQKNFSNVSTSIQSLVNPLEMRSGIYEMWKKVAIQITFGLT